MDRVRATVGTAHPSVRESPRAASFAIPSGLNVVVSLGVLGSVAAAYAMPVLLSGSTVAMLGGALLYGLLKEPLFALMHEADHRILHRRRWVNDVLGIVCAATLPSSFRFHRLAHLAHHSYNRCTRERVEYFTRGARLKRTIFYFAVLLGLLWVAPVLGNLVLTVVPNRLIRRWRLDTDFSVVMPPLSDGDLRAIRLEFTFAVLLHVAIVAFTPVTAAQLGIFLYASALSYSQLRHVVHYGASFDVIEGAFDLRAPPVLVPLLMHGNLHLAHHRYPSVPWVHLPSVARPEDSQHGFLHMLLRQWRGVLSEEEQLAHEVGRGVRMKEPSFRS